MKLYIYVESAELEEIANPIEEALCDWVQAGKKRGEVVNKNDEETGERKLGLHFMAKVKFNLQDPVNFLNSLAKKHKCDFVVGYFDEDSREPEDVCYFGYEEGRPDIHEIGSYLGL